MMFLEQEARQFLPQRVGEIQAWHERSGGSEPFMRAYADEYLRSRNKANLWSQVSEHEFAFRKIVISRPKIAGIGSQEVFKQAAFVLIEKPEDAGGRLYEAIPAIMESLEQVKEKLQEHFDVKPATNDASLNELFGGAPPAGEKPLDMPLAG